MAANDKLGIVYFEGDSMLDIFHEGHLDRKRRFVVDTTVKLAGGGANAYANLQQLCRGGGPDCDPGSHKCRDAPILTRYVDLHTKTLMMEAWSELDPESLRHWFRGQHTLMSANPYFDGYDWSALLLSDYNKGTVSSPAYACLSDGFFNLVVVDSRYRSTHPDFLRLGKVKVWHATGSEYDAEWARQFDYVVHSDAANPVRIYTKDGQELSLLVPQVEVVDPVGAGDTLTAAIAVYLTHHQATDLLSVYNAVAFGIECATEVVQHQYTYVTTKRVVDYEPKSIEASPTEAS